LPAETGLTVIASADGRPHRVAIERLSPQVSDGDFTVKRVLGERFIVEADIVVDGHDSLQAEVVFRYKDDARWHSSPLALVNNDLYRGAFELPRLGEVLYTVRAWVNSYATWQSGLARKLAAGQANELDLTIGATLLEDARTRAPQEALSVLRDAAARLKNTQLPLPERAAFASELVSVMRTVPDLTTTTYERVLRVQVDRKRAAFSAWYEMFPRSTGPAGRHGTLRDCAARLPYVAELGFDVLYLPPIHPIGVTHRKGRNNSLTAQPNDPGSPWAIGAKEGGHKSIHPQLGTFEDFEFLRRRAEEFGIELALDIALQVSPDHPYVHEHPEWFRKRPDGSIQYAENPPKKYQDIYPFWFECPDHQALWKELKSIFDFWIARGVRIFRVDNPHTKSLLFWQWCIAEIRSAHPDVIFLAEAFTRPKLMHALAKRGFSQSYTYFTWRNTAQELAEYAKELFETEVAEFFRPNFWPNTPDILPEHLQHGGRPTFIARLVLAATMSSNYGIYGPAFELMEHVARPGSEEYIDNEKYELKSWDLEKPDSLRYLIARVNLIRRENPALQQQRGFCHHPSDNPQLLCYSRAALDDHNVILVVVNLDPHHRQQGFIHLNLERLGLLPSTTFQVHDLLSDARFVWQGTKAYVELDPQMMPAHIFRIGQKLRSEADFDYFG